MNTVKEKIYPGVFDRVKAVIVDSIILIILIVITTDIFSSFDNVPNIAKIIAFVFIFCLYDPLFTSLLGGTVGHKAIGIRVKRANNPEKNILFHIALLRYIIKGGIGWISLLTVSGNEKRLAIHDSLAGSIVIYSNK